MILKVCALFAIVTFASSHVVSGRVARQALPTAHTWGLHPTNKTVPYRMSDTLSDKEKEDVFTAMKFWSENTCIDFREAKEGDMFVANITRATYSCYSPVGRESTIFHEVNVGCDGDLTTDTHELGHLLGIFHTMDRSDREKYIKSRHLSNTTEYELFGVPYDYGSIMHYDAGDIDDPSFVTTLSIYEQTVGTKIFPSFYDVFLANIINLCNDTCNGQEDAVQCENGGYIHPRDCSKCMCPLGYTGRTCSEIVTIGDCGGILNASDKWQSATIEMNSQQDMPRNAFDRSFCSWHIMAPFGKKIEVNLTDVKTNLLCEVDTLCRIGFEFKIAVDPRLTGPRFCCSFQLTSMVSQLNTVPIIALGGIVMQILPVKLKASFTYRFVDGSTTSTLPDDYGIPLSPLEETTSTEPAECTPPTPTDTEFAVTTDYPMDYSTTDEESTSSPCNNF